MGGGCLQLLWKARLASAAVCRQRLPCLSSDKRLIFVTPGETKDGYYQPLEKAEMVRSGGDVTILCYSRMRYVVMQAVAQLEKEGYDPEVRSTAQAAL
jgi:pyruvate dehydrogenase E1 component beta subunit